MHLAACFAAVAAVLAGAAACASASPSSPGEVALSYTRDMYTHHLAAATAMVLPGDRSGGFHTLTAVAARLPSSTVRGLAVKSVSITGSTAFVTLTGTICEGGSLSDRPYCVTAPGPAFQVRLTMAADGDWYVYFPGHVMAGVKGP
jgi:hypothetical protein